MLPAWYTSKRMFVKDEIEVMWEADVKTGKIPMPRHWRRGVVHKVRHEPETEHSAERLVFLVKYYNGPSIEHTLVGCVLGCNTQVPYQLMRLTSGDILKAPDGARDM